MCDRFVQKSRVAKPGERAMVLMRGPGGEFDLPFEEAVFGGPARGESRGYWIQREPAEPIVPDIERFGDKNKTTGEEDSTGRLGEEGTGRGILGDLETWNLETRGKSSVRACLSRRVCSTRTPRLRAEGPAL